MQRITIVILLLAVACNAESLFRLDNKKLDSRIIGGKPAGPGLFPYVVSIHQMLATDPPALNDPICGGSIIHPRFILTAATCVCLSCLNPSTLRVIAGTHILPRDVYYYPYYVIGILCYPTFNQRFRYSDDISLLVIRGSIAITPPLVQLIPYAVSPVSTGTGPVAGWGTTTDPPTSSLLMKLLYISETIYNIVTCQIRYADIGRTVDNASHVCAIGEPGKGACYGDGGGPLVISGVQVGILSIFARPCTVGAFPDVYTSVSYYSSWISCNIGTIH